MARADATIFPHELLHDCLTRALKEGATITDRSLGAGSIAVSTLSLLKGALII